MAGYLWQSGGHFIQSAPVIISEMVDFRFCVFMLGHAADPRRCFFSDDPDCPACLGFSLLAAF